MICSDFFQLLDNYETLDEAQLKSVEEHASQCEYCRKEFEFFKSVIATSASIPCPAPPETLIAEVNAKLDKAPSGYFERVKNNIRLNVRSYATVAACVAIGLAVGLNGDYFKSRLDDTSTDGVIREVVSHNTGEGESPVASPVVETEKPVKDLVKDEKPASSDIKTPSGEPVKETVPVEKTKPAVKAETVAEPQNAANNEPVVTDTKKDRYTIDKNGYYVPSDNPSATNTPTASPDVSEYSLANRDDTKVAYIVGDDDYIMIDGGDMAAVTKIMSELGVTGSDGVFTTSRANFYRFMDRLDSEGIIYSFEINNSSSDISFKLRYN